jgi:DNA polymerase-3 subunit epsilon
MHLIDVLKLDQPLYGVDLETTGIRSAVDRIVQIAIVRINPDGTEVEWESLIDPGVPIPAAAAEVHKITDERIAAAREEKKAPTFASIAAALYPRLNGKDLLGTNHVSFDNEFFREEFARCGFKWKPGRNVDVYKLIQRAEPRNLKAIIEKVLGVGGNTYRYDVAELREHYKPCLDEERFHDALFDVKGTIAALHGLLLMFPELPRTVEELDALFRPEPVVGALDEEAKFVLRDGVAYVNFGKKHNGRRMDQVDRGFYTWMTNGNFKDDAKLIARNALNGIFPKEIVESTDPPA